MALFSYRGTNLEGAVLEGVIEAPDQQTAAERLKNADIIPLKIFVPEKRITTRLRRMSTPTELLAFTHELAALLRAGLPLDRSLNILAEIAEKKEKAELILSVLRSIREGSSFSEALTKHPRVFSRLYVNMIKAGEVGGVLPEVLQKMAEFLETTQELKEQVLSSLIYPAILVSTGGISILILLTYVLPKFSVIFSEMGTTLPWITQMLLALGRWLQAYWWGGLLLLSAVALMVYTYLRSEEGRYRWDRLKWILMREIIQKLETARFCRPLGTLVSGGVPLLQGLNNSQEVIGNRVFARALEGVAQGVKEGRGLAYSLSLAGVFPALALSMVKVGEETGRLNELLVKVAYDYEKDLRVAIKRFINFLEPALILGMGLIIGFIVLSMLWAVLSITELPI